MIDILPTGFYRARAIEHEFGVADTGTEQVAVTFELFTEDQWNGHQITWFGFFTEGAARHTLAALRVCGWEGDDVADLVGLGRNEVELSIVHETYQGEVRPRVKWVNRAGRPKVKRPMTVEQKRALSARVRDLAVAITLRERGQNGVRPSVSASNGAPPEGYPGL